LAGSGTGHPGVISTPSAQRGFEDFADQALAGDAAFGGAGLDFGQQGIGQTHIDAGGFRLGLPGQGLELAAIEVGEVLVEEGLGLRFSGQVRNLARVS
jgi:hypothetical protein